MAYFADIFGNPMRLLHGIAASAGGNAAKYHSKLYRWQVLS